MVLILAVWYPFGHRCFCSGSVEQTVYTLPHPIWQGEYVDAVKITHNPPKATVDKLAYYTVQLMRFNFDWMSGYSWGRLTEEKWLRRILFLETVAGVPGSVAATLRHLRSLRRMQRDHGWIHTLLVRSQSWVCVIASLECSTHDDHHRRKRRTSECICSQD